MFVHIIHYVELDDEIDSIFGSVHVGDCLVQINNIMARCHHYQHHMYTSSSLHLNLFYKISNAN